MLRRLIADAFGYEPRRKQEPDRVQQVKRYAALLNEKATRFRTVSSRAVLLEQRLSDLESDSAKWGARARRVASRGDAELSADAARICGRLEGQLQESRAELNILLADEAHLRNLLTSERKRFAEQVGQLRDLGDDVSGCLLYVDLTRPERVADTDLLADDDRDFLARVIDGPGVH